MAVYPGQEVGRPGGLPYYSSMRDPEIIDEELMEISAIADEAVKLERIVAWCAAHPDEVPFALHQFMGRSSKKRTAAPPE